MKTMALKGLHRLTLLLVLAAAAQAQGDDPGSQAYDILSKNCFACHGAAKTSGLDLRARESMLAGGTRGPALTPFNLKRSLLYTLASHASEPAMPPGKKLADEDLAILREWIETGATLPRAEAATAKAPTPAIEERKITAEERSFWAFQAPRRVDPPKVREAAWSNSPIDALLRKAMSDRGLRPSPPADRRTLIRRAYLDLLGLPPSPEEVDAFLNDKSAGAWERLVDKLLASPHYGERWARHWLDLVRYADSEGFEFDRDRPEAWRYRDYVVKAFNTDKPYDQFIREQLAGDEYAPASEEAMIATGFLELGPSAGGGERGRQESLDDIVTTTSLTFQALTVGCARCHDHKFDPIPQKDYYRIQAVFSPVRPLRFPLVGPNEVAAHDAELRRINRLQTPLKKAKSDLVEPYKQRLVDEAIGKLPEYLQVAWRTPEAKRTDGQKLNVLQIEKTLKADQLAHRIEDEQIRALMPDDARRKVGELDTQIAQLEAQKPKPYPTAMSVSENGRNAQPSYFLYRGGIDAKGPPMSPGVLSVIGEGEYAFPSPPETAKSSWRRRGFAEWIASPANPLTARVMVNRIWQHHFGEGIVRTPGNFGKLGERPTHPELLDWLATEFVARGWSVKAMHRLMMTSQAYQMASGDIPANAAKDSENRSFWRMPRERLEAEIIRDQILAVAGTLDLSLGGPCVFPYINPDLFQSSTQRTWPGKPEDDPSTARRSLYVFSKRSIRYPLFEAYDQPNLINSCDRRNRSTIAPQALLLMNDSFVILQAKHFAERLRKEAAGDTNAQIQRAYRLALGRPPQESERRIASAYVASNADGLAGLCQALFNLNEFVYRP